MQVELKRIQQEVGITFIYVTHDQEEAMTMSDRIAVMNRGRYEQLGDPESLYERPTTRFVAGFLGVSNLLPATIDGQRRRLRRSPRSPTTPGSGSRAASSTATTTIEVGVRPEKIRLHERRPRTSRPAHNQLQGRSSTPRTSGSARHTWSSRRRGRALTVYEQNVERTDHGSLHRPGERSGCPGRPITRFVVNVDPSRRRRGAGLTPAASTPRGPDER